MSQRCFLCGKWKKNHEILRGVINNAPYCHDCAQKTNYTNPINEVKITDKEGDWNGGNMSRM